jgi:hypothetical protein
MKALFFGVCAIAVAAACGCASILGVEKASCDPTFDPKCDDDGETSGATGSGDGGRQDQTSSQPDSGGQVSAPRTKEQACEEYCDDVTLACAEFPQYLNKNGCEVVCNGMLPQADDESGLLQDTLECRAAVAKNGLNFDDDPQGSCSTAGPMGVGCGDECEKYCAYMQLFCPEEFEELADDCVADCEEVPRKDAYVHTSVYDNTLECRFIHIQLSIQQSPSRLTHCGHAAGKSACVD